MCIAKYSAERIKYASEQSVDETEIKNIENRHKWAKKNQSISRSKRDRYCQVSVRIMDRACFYCCFSISAENVFQLKISRINGRIEEKVQGIWDDNASMQICWQNIFVSMLLRYLFLWLFIQGEKLVSRVYKWKSMLKIFIIEWTSNLLIIINALDIHKIYW